jgi:hypothetical protein
MTPTDADLTQLYKEVNGEIGGKAQPLTTQRIFKAMRAAIEKWRTHTPAGEPVYQAQYKDGFWQDCSKERYEYLKNLKMRSVGDWEFRVLYTAPPVREPLSDERAKALLKNSDLLDMFLHIGWYSAPRKNFDANGLTLIRAIEAAHGITKGEPHGIT